MNTQTNYKGENSKAAWVLGIIAGFVPLIVRLKAMKVSVAAKEIWDNGTGLYADFFSANKVIALGILTIIAFILFIIEYKEKVHSSRDQQENLFHNNKLVIILLGTYLALAVLSTLFSDSSIRIIALLGIPGRYEGLITMVFYVAIMILAIYLGQDWWNVKVIYRVLRLGAFILAVIGVAQFFGWDVLQSDG
ncbi:MAG TPA: hypothetical protein GX731_09415, partial [Clostridiales bacterium]|nr:hypothetical protein [Clostridiales bacterium]